VAALPQSIGSRRIFELSGIAQVVVAFGVRFVPIMFSLGSPLLVMRLRFNVAILARLTIASTPTAFAVQDCTP